MDDVLDEVVGMLVRVTGEDERWAAGVTPHSRLEEDLKLESFELAELGDLLAARYGAAVDLPGYLAALDIDELIALTVGDLVAHVTAARGDR